MKNKKIFNPYEFKSIDLAVKDVDTQGRKVKVVLNTMGVLDSDRDVILPGAFKKSIKERGAQSDSNRKVAFLRHHDWTHPVGKWLELYEEGNQLIGVGQLGTSSKGEDALRDYDEGIIREHSIGFNYIPDKLKYIEDSDLHPDGHFEIKEVMLWEGSAVAFGANEYTPVLDVSKGNAVEMLDKINSQMEAIQLALKNGKGSDERMFNFEMQLKKIQYLYNQIINNQPETNIKSTDRKPGSPTSSTDFFKYLKL